MPSVESFLNNIDTKYYQVIYDKVDNKFKNNCIAYGENSIPELCILKKMNVLDYNCLIIQHILKNDEINNEWLKIIGILFNKDNKVLYSLDIVNKKNTNILEIHLNNITNKKYKVIDKIEKYPGNNKLIYTLINSISNDKCKEIFK